MGEVNTIVVMTEWFNAIEFDKQGNKKSISTEETFVRGRMIEVPKIDSKGDLKWFPAIEHKIENATPAPSRDVSFSWACTEKIGDRKELETLKIRYAPVFEAYEAAKIKKAADKVKAEAEYEAKVAAAVAAKLAEQAAAAKPSKKDAA